MVEITGDIDWTFEKMERDFPKYARAALIAGASVIKEETKATLVQALPAAAKRGTRYSDTLADAVRFSKTEGDEITVHILGVRSSDSGTYRTRFYEDSGKERYQRTYRGKKLKTRRRLGALPRLRFFSTAVSASQSRAIGVMQDRIDKLIDSASK